MGAWGNSTTQTDDAWDWIGDFEAMHGPLRKATVNDVERFLRRKEPWFWHYTSDGDVGFLVSWVQARKIAHKAHALTRWLQSWASRRLEHIATQAHEYTNVKARLNALAKDACELKLRSKSRANARPRARGARSP